MMTPQRWLDLWGTTVKQGLLGCKGAPTIIFDSRLVIADVEGSLAKLHALLERAGVTGLAQPDAQEVRAEIKAFIRTGPRKYVISKAMQAKERLSEQPTVDTTLPTMTAEQARPHLRCAKPRVQLAHNARRRLPACNMRVSWERLRMPFGPACQPSSLSDCWGICAGGNR